MIKKEIKIDDKETIEVSLYKLGDIFYVEVINWGPRQISNSVRSGNQVFCDSFSTEELARIHFEETVKDLG